MILQSREIQLLDEEMERGQFWHIFSQLGQKPVLASLRIFSLSNIQREWISCHYSVINVYSARKHVTLH
jgi:hypothetical protein